MPHLKSLCIFMHLVPDEANPVKNVTFEAPKTQNFTFTPLSVAKHCPPRFYNGPLKTLGFISSYSSLLELLNLAQLG